MSQDRDDRVKLPLAPEEALRALLAVDPESEPETPDDDARDNDAEQQSAPGTDDEGEG